MTIKEQIQKDFMEAFKAKNMEKKTFLGLLKGEIQLEESKETYKGEETVKAIIKKMAKSLKTTNTEESLRELTYLESYLPKQMSEEDLRKEIDLVIETMSLSTMKDMGKVMSHLKGNFEGQYDGKLASTITKESLS